MLKVFIVCFISALLIACSDNKTPDDAGFVDKDNYSTDETAVTDHDIAEVDDEMTEVNDEMTEVDDEMTEVDDEMTEVDDETTEVDDETTEVDDEMTEVDDEDADIIEVPLDGFGEISGSCGVLDSELISDSSFYFLTSIDFKSDPYDEADFSYLTTGGQEIYNDYNMSSKINYSNLFAYEVLARCELAGLLKTEGEINYDEAGAIADLLVDIDGYKIGVNVARAMKFPLDSEYTTADAQTLLTTKLSDISESSLNVSAEDKWEKQILHIIAYADAHATSLFTAYDSLDESVKGDTIVIVTVTDGDDSFLY